MDFGRRLLAGYGAAQAVPGPLFTFAAYLGGDASVPPGGLVGALIALAAIYLPGVLILMGTLPFWQALRARPKAQSAMQGVNAAVVGLLGAAVLPFFRVGGLNIQTTPALHVGATVTIHSRFTPDAALATFERDRPTLTVLVPATIQAVTDHPRWATTNCPR